MSPSDASSSILGRYADAALRCIDEAAGGLPLDDRRAQAYASARRILVRLSCEDSTTPGRSELGVAALPAGLTTPGPGVPGSASLPEIVLSEGRLLDAALAREEERLRQAVAVAPDRPTEPDASAVEAVLRDAGHPEVRVSAVTRVLGGRSKQTMIVDLLGASDLPASVVLRRDLPTSSLGTSVTAEFPLLRALFEDGLPVPEPYQLVGAANGLGQPFLLVQRLEGSAGGSLLLSDPSPGRVEAAAVALAALHALPTSAYAALLGGPAHDALEVRQDVMALSDEWATRSRSEVAVMAAAFDHLLCAVPVDVRASVVTHGDFNFHNLLFDGDQLTAVLDWELTHIGSPAEDLGYIRPGLAASGRWDAFVGHYRDAGGPAVPVEDVHFHCVLSLVRLAVLMLRSREYFETGLTDDPLKADLAMYWLPRLLQALHREMSEVLAVPGTPRRRRHVAGGPRTAVQSLA